MSGRKGRRSSRLPSTEWRRASFGSSSDWLGAVRTLTNHWNLSAHSPWSPIRDQIRKHAAFQLGAFGVRFFKHATPESKPKCTFKNTHDGAIRAHPLAAWVRLESTD